MLVILTSASMIAVGQQRVSVGFYNAENLFDTIPSPFYEDKDFTPQGRNKWNAEKYGQKLNNLSRVIGDAGFDVLGLAEVESEEAVRGLVASLKDDYNYIHRSTSDSRGMDMALLYKGDKFFPERTRQIRSSSSREFLHVRGALAGDTVNVVVCHMPSKFNSAAYRIRAMKRLADVTDSLIKNDSNAKLVVMGDFNSETSEKAFREAFGEEEGGYYIAVGLYGALCEVEKKGYGSYCWEGKWILYDNIIVSESFLIGDGLRLLKGGVFIRNYLLSSQDGGAFTAGRKGYPFRTFSSGRYTGGYSDHLPVFVVLGRETTR